MKKISQDEVRCAFEYFDGHLYWKSHHARNVKIGTRAGYLSGGYWCIEYRGVPYLAHRLIFVYHHGYMPEIIDHIDINRQNNKIENLRAVTQSENCLNTRIRSNNKLGEKNVSYYKRTNRYVVRLYLNKRLKQIGSFEDFELAALVAQEARAKYYGEFYRCIR
jgi:hypothetical protein